MSTSTLSRVAAGCGAVFAIVLVVANGDGSQTFSGPRAVAGIAALTLAIPFICYLCSVLRDADRSDGWLVNTALAAGIGGIILKLFSGAPELALYRAHVADHTPLHNAINEIAGGVTVMSLYPLAIFCAATAIVSFRTHALPRWLAIGAAITAAALAVNGGFLNTSSVPALLLFTLWVLLASVHLMRAGRRVPMPVPSTVAPA